MNIQNLEEDIKNSMTKMEDKTMKKNILSTLAALFCMAAAMVSCSGDEEIINQEKPTNEPEMRTVTVRLVSETETRTMLGENAALLWEEGDKVSYYTKTSGSSAWSTSQSATVNYEQGTFTATFPSSDTEIMVVYPAVADESTFAETQYEVVTDQTGKEIGDLLPMKALADLPAEGRVIDAVFDVCGAVVKVTVKGIPSSEHTTRIRRVQLGDYYRDLTDNNAEQTDTYFFVLPKGNIDYTAAVYTTDYDTNGNFVTGHVYQRNTQMKADFVPQAYAMSVDVSNREKYYDISLTGTREGHDWVDLGILKSDYDNTVAARSENDFRMLFSTVNIGSDTPEKSTLYFRWGETGFGWRYSRSGSNDKVESEPYGKIFAPNSFSANAYNSYDLYPGWGTEDEDIQGGSGKYTKTDENHNTYSIYYGDIASSYWSTGWCMMNKLQADFLLASENISKTWTTKNDVSGYELKNKITDASVFLPAVGHLNGEAYPRDTEQGYYWLSVAKGGQPLSYILDLSSSKIKVSTEERYIGCSVRPISFMRYYSPKLNNSSNGLPDFEVAGSMF